MGESFKSLEHQNAPCSVSKLCGSYFFFFCSCCLFNAFVKEQCGSQQRLGGQKQLGWRLWIVYETLLLLKWPFIIHKRKKILERKKRKETRQLRRICVCVVQKKCLFVFSLKEDLMRNLPKDGMFRALLQKRLSENCLSAMKSESIY